MNDDPAGEVAEQQLAIMALDVAIQLERGSGMRPVLWLLVEARKRAAAAFSQFLTVDPNDSTSVRLLQNHVQLYHDYLTDIRLLLSRGKEADLILGEEDRDEIDRLTDAKNYERSPQD